ncbi:MAG: DMT family transporter [Paracoccaceae bacterium]
MDARKLGALLVIASTVPFALSGVFTRFITADVWSVLAWRGLFGGMAILAYLIWRGRITWSLGWQGWILAVVGAAASAAFLAAFKLTYVANVALIYAVTPFAAAGFGWLLLREKLRRAVLVASCFTLFGVAIIVAGGLGAPRALGDSVAVAMMLLSGLYLVLVRMFAGIDAVLAGVVSSALLIVLSLIVSDPLAMSAVDLAWAALFGLSFAVGFILWTEGAALIPAAESALLGGAEIPFAVLFAWLLLAEVPPVATLLGGSIVLVAVLWRALADAKAASADVSQQ